MTSHRRAGLYVSRPFGDDGPAGYDSEVMADSPLWYNLTDETSGTVANDVSGNSHNGSFIGVYSLQQASIMPTDVGPSIRVGSPGVGGGAINIIADPWLVDALDGPFTHEAWFKFDSLGGNRGIMSRYQNGSAGEDGLLWLDLSAQLQSNWHFASGYARTTPLTISTGVTYHLVQEYDGTDLNLYVNGSLVAQAAASGVAASSGSTHFNFGSYGNTSYWTDGWLQKPALYDHAIGAARVAAHYAAG